jgi:hypothetical protein
VLIPTRSPVQEYKHGDEETAGLLTGEGLNSLWDDVFVTWTLAWPIFGTFILQVGYDPFRVSLAYSNETCTSRDSARWHEVIYVRC